MALVFAGAFLLSSRAALMRRDRATSRPATRRQRLRPRRAAALGG